MPNPNLKRDLSVSVAAAAILGAFSTAADWIWANYLTDGAILPGVIHGVLIFAILAVVLGRAAGDGAATKRLLLTLPLAGLLLAAAFYPLAYVTGYLGALLLTWVGMWVALALLQRWARGKHEPVARSLLRALVAAIGSGLAFWAISGIWTDPTLKASYGVRLIYWTFAFLPGFLALLWKSSSSSDS